MTEITIDESKLKELLKTALFELMQEEKAMFSELLSDVMEEIAMSNAIKGGKNTEIVSQEEIFKILEQ
jgi:Asp-tRNA(Asn)/Glu-tRNA(Gln) amidotransferase C subunit